MRQGVLGGAALAALFALAFGLAAEAQPAGPAGGPMTAPLGPPPPQSPFAIPSPASPIPVDPKVADAKFAAFVQSFRATALAQGIRPETYDRSMVGIARNPRVEQANLQQPEFVKPIWDYLDGAVSEKRVMTGSAVLVADRAMLDDIEKRFGVPREYLVAIWAIESDFGQSMGHMNMFEALATLAYDGPRMEFGQRELIAAMKMEERENLDPRQMTSSWAGAFGQTQFVPSSFLTFAVDGDHDGRIDLWHSPADSLASTASHLANSGWKADQGWGYEVTLPAGFDYADADIDTVKPLADWVKLGVRRVTGEAIAPGDKQAAILLPAGVQGPAFLVFDNFKVVLKYNNAQSYALAVCLLADRIKGGLPVLRPWPRGEIMLSRDERIAFQNDLRKLGYDPGDSDGVLGHRVRASVRAYQKAHSLPADGFVTMELLTRIERELVAKGG